MGKTWLALYPRDELAADAGVPATGNGFSGFSLAHNVRSADEVDRLMAEVVLRYDDRARELVGLTVIGLRARLLKELGADN